MKIEAWKCPTTSKVFFDEKAFNDHTTDLAKRTTAQKEADKQRRLEKAAEDALRSKIDRMTIAVKTTSSFDTFVTAFTFLLNQYLHQHFFSSKKPQPNFVKLNDGSFDASRGIFLQYTLPGRVDHIDSVARRLYNNKALPWIETATKGWGNRDARVLSLQIKLGTNSKLEGLLEGFFNRWEQFEETLDEAKAKAAEKTHNAIGHQTNRLRIEELNQEIQKIARKRDRFVSANKTLINKAHAEASEEVYGSAATRKLIDEYSNLGETMKKFYPTLFKKRK